jgi:hypothetical protein
MTQVDRVILVLCVVAVIVGLIMRLLGIGVLVPGYL